MANGTENRMIRVLDHIHDNPAGDLSLDALADVAAMSRFHWHRLFRAITGETAAQAVRRMRMPRAAVALVQTDQPLEQVARAVGYPNRASFTRVFTDSYALSPTGFRKRGELRPYPSIQRPEVILMYPVILRHDPARRLAAMPHKGPYPEIGRAFEKLAAIAKARGLHPANDRMVGVYYDDPASRPADDLRSHAGAEVGPEMQLAAPLEEVLLPAGRHAVLTFKGPYAGLPAAYDQLFSTWLPGSGHEPADSPVFEVYLNSPMDTAPEDLITEICLPLKG
ncbi:MAG: AraC family transcriptional regulator [Rhodobacteraceae bacterium]|nr:AraC family transcriptional regulator [Paracoccaceae bacterium]